MKWTKTPPSEPGYYWCRWWDAEELSGAEKWPVEVVQSHARLWVQHPPDDSELATALVPLHQWGGNKSRVQWSDTPIPEPEE